MASDVIGDLFPKYGLDTNVLVDLILYPRARDYFKNRGYSFPDKFYIPFANVSVNAKVF